jgi:multimeric flavodoxin WrbA
MSLHIKGGSGIVELSAMEAELCERSDRDYSDLRAVYINCTLKRSPEVSNTQGLADRSIAVLEHLGVWVDVVRAVDRQIATSVWSDMTEHGWESDGWPEIFSSVLAADILVILSPIWLGEKSSVCTRMIKDAGGIPVRGNQRSAWDAGCRFGYENPEHR